MTHQELEARFAKIDQAIRDGELGPARRELLRLKKCRVPRVLKSRFAALGRRAGLPTLGVSLLRPYVRPGPDVPPSARESEIIEYAACLTRLGLVVEAWQLLAPLDSRRFPRVDFERAAALLKQWRYDECIPLLQSYLAQRSLSPYEKMVGRANLAAAFVHEAKYDKALPLLSHLLHETSVRKYRLLMGSVLQVAAMAFFSQRRLAPAERLLEDATRALSEPLPLERLFLRKWRAMIALSQGRLDRKALRQLREVEREAAGLRHWETVRDCERFWAVRAGDERRLWRVYFGTPYARFRESLLKAFRGTVRPPTTYLWAKGAVGEERVFDLSAGGNRKTICPGTLPDRLMAALCSDFYRPFSLYSLFQLVYPGEWFHPVHSVNRLHQNLHALRAQLKKQAQGIQIVEEGGDYRVVLAAGWGVRVPLHWESHLSSASAVALGRLKKRFGPGWFITVEAAQLLSVSRRSALRLINEGLESGELERSGERLAARYRFAGQGKT